MRLLSYQERLNRYTRENGATILYGLKIVLLIIQLKLVNRKMFLIGNSMRKFCL